MKRSIRWFLAVVLALGGAGWVLAAGAIPASSVRGKPRSPAAFLEYMDGLYRSSSSRSRMVMEISQTSWKRTLRMDVWTRGLESTFIRVLEPKKDRGVASLRIKYEMWNFFPKIDKILKVPPSMMTGSWMGSDFTNDDLVKETTLKDDYTSRFVEEPRPARGTFVIELKPKEDSATVWGKILLVVRERDWVPLEEAFWDEKGRQVRLLTFSDVRMVSGRALPYVMEMRPLGREGRKTVIRYEDIVFDADLPPSTFTMENLRRGGL